MTSRDWQVLPISGAGPGSTWGIDMLGSKQNTTLCDYPAGAYIRRVRVQGSFSFMVTDTDPTTTEMRPESFASENITWGVWAGVNGVSTPSQLPPQQGTLDDRWVFWNQMTPRVPFLFHTQAPDDRWIATWTFEDKDKDSHSSRLNDGDEGTIELCWGFDNPTYEPMRDTVPNLLPFYGYALTWSVLIETP